MGRDFCAYMKRLLALSGRTSHTLHGHSRGAKYRSSGKHRARQVLHSGALRIDAGTALPSTTRAHYGTRRQDDTEPSLQVGDECG